MTIGALAGVRDSDARIATGLINTTPQIGGAIGVAVATTVAATSTSHYLGAHPGADAASGAPLTHGFNVTFLVLAAVAAAAIGSTLLVEFKRALAETGIDAAEVVPQAA